MLKYMSAVIHHTILYYRRRVDVVDPTILFELSAAYLSRLAPCPYNVLVHFKHLRSKGNIIVDLTERL